MARKKPLEQLVQDGTFLARKDAHMLVGPGLPWEAFATLQRKFRVATEPFEQRAVALAFERLVRQAKAEAEYQLGPVLAESLARLGPAGSFQQLERFFPWALRHYQGAHAGKRFRLERFQREFLSEFWRRRKNGRRVYSVGLLAIPKGNGKTPLAAGLGLYALLSDPNAPQVFGVAGSRQQAGIARDFARSWAEERPLSAWLRAGSTIRCREHQGSYSVLSSDGRLSQGVNPSAGLVDEWWLFAHQRERETYNALSKALHKRSGQSWLLAITTAGWDKQSQLGETYDKALNHPKLEVRKDGFLRCLRDTKSGFLMHWYGPPEGADQLDLESPALIRACNPASWVRPADLIAELKRPDTDEYDWRRLHLNCWTKARDAWLPVGCWAKLGSELDIPAGADIYAGVDVGWSHDSTAVAWAHRLEDGRIALRAKVWTTDEEDPALRAGRGRASIEFVPGGKMRLELVEQFVRELRGRYKLRELAYDPTFFARSAELLEGERLIAVELMPSSAPMRAAWQAFYQAAVEGRITHDRDPVLATHVEAAAAERTEQGWRVRKLRSTSRIDALAAAVMAHARCDVQTRTKKIGPQIFWMELGP